MSEITTEHQAPMVFQLGRDLYLSALPEQDDLAAFYDFTKVWQSLEFDQKTGPIYDEANKLQSSWWHDGSAAAREKVLSTIRALGQALGFPSPVTAS